MNHVFEGVVLASLCILTVYVSIQAVRLQRSERTVQALLHGLVPSQRVRALAADPKNRIEAMRLFRVETGADVRIALAVIESLRTDRFGGAPREDVISAAP